MILIRPSARIVSTLDAPRFILKDIEAIGRTCYKSEDRITDESAEAFVTMLLKRGHESVIEHVSASVRFVVDRGVSHEIVRHRLASYSQESTRYCNYGGKHMTFIIPPWVNIAAGEYSLGDCIDHGEGEPPIISKPDYAWMLKMLDCEDAYNNLIERGWKPEQARSVLPNSLKTELVMTANLREWRHFFRLRTASAAHPQMREVAIPLLKEFQAAFHPIFNDIAVT